MLSTSSVATVACNPFACEPVRREPIDSTRSLSPLLNRACYPNQEILLNEQQQKREELASDSLVFPFQQFAEFGGCHSIGPSVFASATNSGCFDSMCRASCLNVRWQQGHTPLEVRFLIFVTSPLMARRCRSFVRSSARVWSCDARSRCNCLSSCVARPSPAIFHWWPRGQ